MISNIENIRRKETESKEISGNGNCPGAGGRSDSYANTGSRKKDIGIW